MDITSQTRVSDLAVSNPATIRVFQRYHIDFCCGGKMPLADACERRGMDPDVLVAELREISTEASGEADWLHRPMSALITHIQDRYHNPLREELPRLSLMLEKVVVRHGDALPATLFPLRQAFEALATELLDHMAKEDAVLFPSIAAMDAPGAGAAARAWTWIERPIDVMEAEHASAGEALARMRAITDDYTPPEWACPTFRGLYYGLAELERDMQVHVHLENHILFPRAAHRARELTR
jgi:regulator of cell morphogenesis and NO signaling